MSIPLRRVRFASSWLFILRSRRRTLAQASDLSENDKEIIKRHEEAIKRNLAFYEDPETKYIVWTTAKHLKRGKCCGSACRHCPFDHENVKDEFKKNKKYNGYFYY